MVRGLSVRQLARLNTGSFRMGVFVMAPCPVDGALISVIGKAITGPVNPMHEEELLVGGFRNREIETPLALNWDFFPESEPFTVSESACAFRLPSLPFREPVGLPVRRSRTSMACLPPRLHKENPGIRIALNEHLGTVQPVHLEADDRMRHTFMIGQTGTGKSTLMENMILQDIRRGAGVAVIDPHGDMVDSILGKIPRERIEDVILFDVLDKDRPVGFNLIEWRNVEERDLIIDEIYLTLDRIYNMKAVGGPIFEMNFRGMLKLLTGEKADDRFTPTVLDFTSCYLNKGFRHWLKERTHDPQVLDYVEELERTGGDASLNNLSPYVTSKFARFTTDVTLRRIVGQEKTGFDFDEIMNRGKVFLVKLGRGRFGGAVSALLANQLVSRFKLAALKRGCIRQEERKDFFLYVDESQNLPSENFTELLSEARKFRMGLILAAQYADQLKGTGSPGSDLLSAILGNVGSVLIFRLGQKDAEHFAPLLQPNFNAIDIVGLPNWQGYTRLQVGQDPSPPFSFRTMKDEAVYDRTTAKRIREQSRLKYGTEAYLVDEQINRRRIMWKESEKGS